MESLGIQGLSTVSRAKRVSVNGIIRLMESVCLGPKVIPLSGAHCKINFVKLSINN
jgi:hypothetical protein